MVKGKLQARLTKVNSGKGDGGKVGKRGNAPPVKSKQEHLFGAGVNYRIVLNVFVWTYHNLIRRLWNPL